MEDASWSGSVENVQWFHHSSKHWSYLKGNQMEDASWSENVEMCNDLTIHQNTGVT